MLSSDSRPLFIGCFGIMPSTYDLFTNDGGCARHLQGLRTPRRRIRLIAIVYCLWRTLRDLAAHGSSQQQQRCFLGLGFLDYLLAGAWMSALFSIRARRLAAARHVPRQRWSSSALPS